MSRGIGEEICGCRSAHPTAPHFLACPRPMPPILRIAHTVPVIWRNRMYEKYTNCKYLQDKF